MKIFDKRIKEEGHQGQTSRVHSDVATKKATTKRKREGKEVEKAKSVKRQITKEKAAPTTAQRSSPAKCAGKEVPVKVYKRKQPAKKTVQRGSTESPKQRVSQIIKKLKNPTRQSPRRVVSPTARNEELGGNEAIQPEAAVGHSSSDNEKIVSDVEKSTSSANTSLNKENPPADANVEERPATNAGEEREETENVAQQEGNKEEGNKGNEEGKKLEETPTETRKRFKRIVQKRKHDRPARRNLHTQLKEVPAEDLEGMVAGVSESANKTSEAGEEEKDKTAEQVKEKTDDDNKKNDTEEKGVEHTVEQSMQEPKDQNTSDNMSVL